jgi:hypothetical protein
MMRMNTFWIVVLALGFLSGCAQMSPIVSNYSNEIRGADVSFIDPNNHNAVAKHYEDVAKEMKAKLEAQKEQLEEYERHNYYYGRKGQNFRSHTWANIRHLENSLKENLEEAAVHRKMAQDQQKQDVSLRAK